MYQGQAFIALALLAAVASAHDGEHDHTHAHAAQQTAHPFHVAPATIRSTGVKLAGEWVFPDKTTTVPCVVVAGGTLSHTRDGAFTGGGEAGAARDALWRLSKQLAAAGYASLRWDKRGHGHSPAGPQPVTNELEAEDVAAAIALARNHPRVTHVIVAGESAGAYFACLAASNGAHADAYLFLGALASPSRDLFAYNYGRLAEWAAKDEDNAAWAAQHAPASLAVGHHYQELFKAAAQSDATTFTFSHAGRQYTRSLVRIRTEIEHPPADLFRHIRSPALVLQGAADLNVPPGDAQRIGRLLRNAGVTDVKVVEIPGVDHSFQYSARDPDERMRDRHGFGSFYHLYSPRLYAALAEFLHKRFPSDAAAASAPEEPRPGIIHWPGIQIIDDVTDTVSNPGVPTLEGTVGPLMNGDNGQARFFWLPAGLYLHEHPHANESLIFTVTGEWVLCSSERRHHMRPGALFWFKGGVATGYEVPFDKPAYILIFKAPRSDWSDERFWEYLEGLADRCAEANREGQPFRFHELPAEHPARQFAREVNPAWEATLPQEPDTAARKGAAP